MTRPRLVDKATRPAEAPPKRPCPVLDDAWIEAFMARRELGWREGKEPVPGVVVTIEQAATWAGPEPVELWHAAQDLVGDVRRGGLEPPSFSQALNALRTWSGRRFSQGSERKVSHG